MITPRPSVLRFATDVVGGEAAHGPGISERITRRLHAGLGKLIGTTGFDVLLARTLVLAERAHPTVRGLRAGPAGALLHDDAGHDTGELDAHAAAAILAHFVELLISLVGEDLALRLVRDLWPPVSDEKEWK